MAKRFFYVCAGLLCLALTYHLGARSATAQAPGNPIVGLTGSSPIFYTANGDIYESTGGIRGPYVWTANVFSGGGPTPTNTQESFGSLKARYRGEREPQGVKQPTNR